jgi:hypothetical protein
MRPRSTAAFSPSRASSALPARQRSPDWSLTPPGLGAAAWTSSCRQDGCCSHPLQAEVGPGESGPTACRTSARRSAAKKLFDPRSSTTAWSNNWALCVRDWLTDLRQRPEVPCERDQRHLLNAAANLSDEAVALLAGGTEPRYTCNGTYDASKTRGTVISRAAHRGRRPAVPGAAGSGTCTAAPGARRRSRWAMTTSARGCSSPRAAAAATCSAA